MRIRGLTLAFFRNNNGIGFGSRYNIEEGYRLWLDDSLHSNSYIYVNDDSYAPGWLVEPTAKLPSDGK